MLLLLRGEEERETVERLETAEIVALASELSVLASLPCVLGPLGEPLFESHLGELFKVGTIGGGVLLPLVVRLSWRVGRKRMPRGVNVGVSSLVLLGGFLLRYVWIKVGRASADDPKAIHYYNELEWKGRTRKRESHFAERVRY